MPALAGCAEPGPDQRNDEHVPEHGASGTDPAISVDTEQHEDKPERQPQAAGEAAPRCGRAERSDDLSRGSSVRGSVLCR